MPVKALQEHLQSRIDSERDLPTFGSDPRSKAYLMLASVKDTFGGEALEYLCTWQKFIFVQGGDDRVEEFVWGILASELFERASELKLGAEFYSALQSFRSLSEKRLSEFRKRIFDASATSLSVWDQNAIAAEGESLDTVLNLVTNICSSNIFTLTWHETCTSRGPAFLEGIFEIAVKAALEDTSGRLIFSARSAMAGVDLPTLKELMGHTSITTTMRYVHPTPEHKRQAMEKLEQFNLEQVLLAHSQNEGSVQKSLQ